MVTVTTLDVGIALPTIMDVETLENAGGVAAAARHVEKVGLDSVSIADLIIGDGTPSLDAVVAATAAATATEQITVEFGVLALPLRPVVQLAAQIATLQYMSSNRIALGVGIGGFPEAPYWQAAGVSARTQRPARTASPSRLTAGTGCGNANASPRPAPSSSYDPISIGRAAWSSRCQYGQLWVPV